MARRTFVRKIAHGTPLAPYSTIAGPISPPTNVKEELVGSLRIQVRTFHIIAPIMPLRTRIRECNPGVKRLTLIIPLATVIATGIPNINGPINSEIVTTIKEVRFDSDCDATAVAITLFPSFIPFVSVKDKVSTIVTISNVSTC